MTDDETGDKRLIKSYVWHEGKCFFVSTIDRDCSSMLGGRFSETIVWEWDWENDKRKHIVYESGSIRGSIKEHQRICAELFANGKVEDAP